MTEEITSNKSVITSSKGKPDTQKSISSIQTKTESKIINASISSGTAAGIFGDITFLDENGARGWVIDMSNPNSSLTVNAYINNNLVGTGTARISHPDIASAIQHEANCGFHIEWDWRVLAETAKAFDPNMPCSFEVRIQGYDGVLVPKVKPMAYDIFKWINLKSKALREAAKDNGINSPHFVQDAKNPSLMGGYFFDRVLKCGRLMIFQGWQVNVSQLTIFAEKQALSCKLSTHDRPDISSIGFSPDNSGFIVTAWLPGDEDEISIKITCCGESQLLEPNIRLVTIEELSTKQHLHHHEPIANLMRTLSRMNKERMMEIAVDQIIYCKNVGLVVFGWRLTRSQNVDFFISDGRRSATIGGETSINRPRPDLQNELLNSWYGHANYEPGFATRLDFTSFDDNSAHRVFWGIKTDEIPGVWLTSKEVDEIAPDPVALAKALFSIPETLPSRWNQRMLRVDGVLIRRLLEQQQHKEKPEPKIIEVGGSPEKPEISIIVPIYGRFDFVEHQLLGFSSDPGFKNGQYELIYVIDDPRLDETAEASREWLYALYGVPFKLVIGRANRGYSGANNLGAKHARSQTLLFLNSDVFVSHADAGWLDRLKATLESSTEIGAVGPVLIYPAGGIQHAGMARFSSDYMSMDMNYHPRQGLDHRLISADSLPYEAPMLTGACLMMQKTTYEIVGGWDEGYLIGDFEDSDICNEITRLGKRLFIEPSIRLWHLERQSMPGIGQSDFRQGVMFLNGLRYMQKTALEV